MLISRISDENEGAGEGNGIEVERVSSQEYQTASELFDLMTKNRHFNDNDDNSLTAQDVVLLYKNIDIGTRLMNDATDIRRRKPNQYVETVVYNDEPESDSDLSENFISDDLQNVFKINQERLNLLDNGSFDNILCHKLGGLEIKSSDLATDYNRQFLFKDPYIKEQLKNLNAMASCSEFESLFPTSLLDYICCKRLEDNYNFYMDNIIRYVQHTIEQLKRISNGDYLTDRAKEKWEEIKKNDIPENGYTKVLATSTSIPLHVECKKRGNATWDDIVHSEVDVRSLSKILEKKIVVEIPKLICGSYRLFSKRCDDNLIISCKREKEDEESRLDVVLKLQRSQSGQVISNISSIMILQTTPAVQDLRIPEVLPLTYKSSNDITLVSNDDSKENTITIVECANDVNELVDPQVDTTAVIKEAVTEGFEDRGSLNDESNIETNDYPFSDSECVVPYDITSNQYSSESSVALRDILGDQFGTFPNRNEATFNLVSPDELRVAMQRLNMQKSLPEESGEDVSATQSSKKKSPVRVRIKSPYENQSYILEEKKRKRLIEIREKREKKKMALGENAKVSKHKYLKGTITPQASNSVTKLSITNKSFYNSIYGQSLNGEKSNTKLRKGLRKDTLTFEVPIEQMQEEYCESPNLTPEKNSKKYINRSYYLDDTETEVMYTEMKRNVRNTCSASTSAVSNEFSVNLNLLSQLIGSSETDFNKDETVELEQNQSLEDDIYNNSKDAGCSNDIPPAEILVPLNSPQVIVCELDSVDNKKEPPVTVECRKSIDKLYSLMKKLGKGSNTDLKNSRSKLNVRTVERFDATTGGSTIQGSDSGTSLKHHLTSSNPSCFSFGKTNAENPKPRAISKKEQATAVVPKVIISSKLQTAKLETDKLKKDRKRVIISPPKTVPENPLKAISQLLHEFDNVQKTRQKTIPEGKPLKKTEVISGDGKPVMSRQNSFRRRSRLDQHIKENDQDKKITVTTPRRSKPLTPMEFAKIPLQQNASEDKHIDRVTKKKVADIIDEAKEARGEAVRGPSKLNSRLHSLAQPKKSYVQAHSEEYQHKYGKNLMADRLQRLATAAPPAPFTEPIVRNVISPTARNRIKREPTSSVSVKQPPPSMQPIDKPGRVRRSVSSSPNRNKSPTLTTHKHNGSEAPDTMKKMVAVESYVKSHYGLGSPPRSELLLAGNKSRLPLLPSDIELASMTSSRTAEESNELGKKLHRIIDSMITTVPAPLTPLAECHDTTPKLSRDNTDDISVDNLSRDQRTDSDYKIDILEDKNVETAVESHSSHTREDSVDDMFGNPDQLNNELQPFNSSTELEKLENALYSQISGVFQKRLRLKNLTLTPKQSVQQVFLLQSGDAGSLVVKSTASNLKMKCDESLHDLKAVPVLSNSHLNWNFAHIPMQFATVGYTFPIYQSDGGTKLDLKSLSVSRTALSEHESNKSKSDKISQCFKGVPQEQKSEQAAQATVEEIKASSQVIDSTEEAVAKTSELMDELTSKELPKDIGEPLPNISEEKQPANENSENISDKKNPLPSPDNVDYTTSLDMLVGLLNEIQKITCQNPAKDQSNCTELETILCNAAALENNKPRDLVSMTSLDKLRQLESNPSIYSFYISSEGSPSSACIITEPAVNKPVFVDKEVSVNLSEKELVNTFTDVPSLMPIAVNHSTDVTNSLIGVISEPSSQSMFSFTDYHTLYSNTFFSTQSIKRIVELPQVVYDEKVKEPTKTDLNEKCCEITSPVFEVAQLPEHKCSIVAHRIEKKTVKDDFESGMKIKRDILVTVYSILVFTVFAALSLPDMTLFEG